MIDVSKIQIGDLFWNPANGRVYKAHDSRKVSMMRQEDDHLFEETIWYWLFITWKSNEFLDCLSEVEIVEKLRYLE